MIPDTNGLTEFVSVEQLAAIDPQSFQAYLSADGWRCMGIHGDAAERWAAPTNRSVNGGRPPSDVLLPLEQAREHVLRIGEAIGLMALSAGTSQAVIAHQLITLMTLKRHLDATQHSGAEEALQRAATLLIDQRSAVFADPDFETAAQSLLERLDPVLSSDGAVSKGPANAA